MTEAKKDGRTAARICTEESRNISIGALGTHSLLLFATYPAGCHRNGQILHRSTPQDDRHGKKKSWCVGKASHDPFFFVEFILSLSRLSRKILKVSKVERS
jgi:hypothetical protein